jgi:tripartite-type tricarboxylate transporter receptor subunit TctC
MNRIAYYGIYGTKGLSVETVTKVHDAVKKTLDDPQVRARIEETGSVIIANSPSEFAAQIRTEYETYKRLKQEQNLKSE